MQVPRRALLGSALGSMAVLLARPAFAGSYLNRAALLLACGRREADFLRQHFADKELARVVHRQATARVVSANKMLVPKDVVLAHPHLLLVFENFERAAEAVLEGSGEPEIKRFMTCLQLAFDEERSFRAVLKQLGWDLPKV